MRVSFILFALIVVFGVDLSLGFTSGINSVVSSLADYQSKSGGFRPTKESEATTEATAHALFLSSLFGLRDKINSADVPKFIESVSNPGDHGFSNQPGQPSDLESVRNALLCLNHLGNPLTLNTAGIGAFIESLFDNLYANTLGGSGSLKSTAIAFQTLDSLNLLQSPNVVSKKAVIKTFLEGLIRTEKNAKFFSSLTADNYYAIVVGHYVGITFDEPEQWAQYFRARQVRDGSSVGGFYSDQTQNEILLDDAYYAVAALHTLQEATKSARPLPDTINTDNLLRYAGVLPRSLKAAALIYNAIARTSALQSVFKINSVYDVSDNRFRTVGNRIIQGSQIKPTLSVRTVYGLAHAGLDVSLTTTHKSSASSSKLTWNADTQEYGTEDQYDTGDKLGDVTFDYVIRWLVADLGKDLVINLSETKTVGYDLTVRPKAVHAGKEIEKKGTVAIGTDFSFDVALGTVKNAKPSLLSGDFSVLFTVRDSSDVVIHRQIFDGKTNTKPISFQYTLNTANIPGGDLKFTFDIGSSAGIHTTDFVTYNLPLTMVASEITFKNFENRAPVYRIGETVDVTIVPGSLPDLRTVKTYPAKDNYNLPARRKFFMDVTSADSNVVLYSLPGTSAVNEAGNVAYNFQLPVSATFYSIGNNVVSFHYETAAGVKIPLQLFDSRAGELFEDGSSLSYSVNTELHLKNLNNEPRNGNLDYGNEVIFSFQVFDSVSGQNIFNGADSKQATVYIVLKHKLDNGLSYTSTKQPAQQIAENNKPSHFSVQWEVNPNAVKGSGSLSLVAQGADGKEIPIYIENSKDIWQVNIEIGGDLSVEEHHFSSEIDDEDTIFFVDLELSCRTKKLSEAELIASVNTGSSKLSLPVTHGREAGQYQLSWFQPTSQVRSGQYTIQFYRKVDSLRVAEKGGDLDQLDSLFEIKFTHRKTSAGFFIQSEVIALLLLGSGFVYMVYQKMELEGLRELKKSKKNK
jgi:hypothetical protein